MLRMAFGALFAYFETIIAYFESRAVKMLSFATIYSVVSRIQALTLCPMRCLKARLKVL